MPANTTKILLEKILNPFISLLSPTLKSNHFTEDTSVVIENKMAQNLGAKTASERLAGPRPTSTIIKPKENRPETRKM